MKICLVTAFPPSRGGLSEYGFHMARELRQNPLLSLTVLADAVPDSPPEHKDFSVVRCWSFNDPKSPYRLLKMIRSLNPDVVWFNLLFTTFGHNPLVAFGGLSLPLLTRMNGYYTHVTLHHLMDTIDLDDADVRFPRLYRAAGVVATRMLLMANSVSVLMPAYRNILQQKYGGDNVHLRAHGIFSRTPEYPDFSRRGNPTRRILAFGKWGTYKRLEPMIEAFKIVAETIPNVKLVIGGGDHPRTPGYVASVARKYESPSIEFTGYVPEEKIPDMFKTASVMAMPYSSSTGSSGVAHQACAYGVPIVSSDIPDFRHMAQEEGMAVEFYEPNNMRDLAAKLIELLESPERQTIMAKQNFSAALRMTMPRIMHGYLRQFDLASQNKAMKPIRRYRRLPQWLSQSFLGRAVLPGSLAQAHRTGLSHSWLHAMNGNGLPDGDVRGRRDLHTAGTPVNGYGVSGTDLNRAHRAAAGNAAEGHAKQGKNQDGLHPILPFYVSDHHESDHAKREQPAVEESLPLYPPVGSAGPNGNGGNNGNSKNGAHSPSGRADGGREGAGHSNGKPRTRK